MSGDNHSYNRVCASYLKYEHIIEVLKKYWVFSGRASRTEYWTFTLVDSVGIFVLAIVYGYVGGFLVTAIAALYVLLVLPPRIGALVRRLHDAGYSANWILLTFIPYIGGLVLVFGFLIRKSQDGDNTYGSSPYAPAVSVPVASAGTPDVVAPEDPAQSH